VTWPKKRRDRRLLTDEQARAVYLWYHNDEADTVILASAFRVSRSVIRRIIYRLPEAPAYYRATEPVSHIRHPDCTSA
jgi:predicted DNA-binding protein YlxM (UPF0122 family)